MLRLHLFVPTWNMCKKWLSFTFVYPLRKKRELRRRQLFDRHTHKEQMHFIINTFITGMASSLLYCTHHCLSFCVTLERFLRTSLYFFCCRTVFSITIDLIDREKGKKRRFINNKHLMKPPSLVCDSMTFGANPAQFMSIFFIINIVIGYFRVDVEWSEWSFVESDR